MASTLDLRVSFSTFDRWVSIRRLTLRYPPTSLFLPLINYSLVHFLVYDSDLTMRVMMERRGITEP